MEEVWKRGNSRIGIQQYFKFYIEKNKGLDESDSFCNLEQVIKSDGFVIGYQCCYCDQESEDLEEIAVWED